MAAVREAMWVRRSAAVIAEKFTTVAWGTRGAGAHVYKAVTGYFLRGSTRDRNENTTEFQCPD